MGIFLFAVFYQVFCKKFKIIKKTVAFASLDVDLVSSMQDCLKYIWPLLIEGGYIFSDDSCDMEVVKVWFNENWWKNELGQNPPGYVGSGCGLPLTTYFSSLGYALKITDKKSLKRVFWLYYPDNQSEENFFAKEKNK